MHLIVDAFNVLHAWGTGPDSGGFHEVESLAGLIQSSRYAKGRVSIVCDGARFPASSSFSPISSKIVFAGGGKDADALIESLISRDSGPRELVVASSDRRLQRAAGRRGSKWLTSERFLGQILRDSVAPSPEPIRPEFARKTPLAGDTVDHWLSEFDISADFAGPRADPITPKGRPASAKKQMNGPSRPAKQESSPPILDPLLREALDHWRDRLAAEDLDMKKWLEDPKRQ